FLAVLLASRAWGLNCGRVDSARGEVEILRLKSGSGESVNTVRKPIKVKNRQNLSCHDIIVTGKSSRAKLRLEGGTVLSLGPHSRISIEDYAKTSGSPTLLHLTYGKVRTLFQANEEKDSKSTQQEERNQADPANQDLGSFRIRTSTAVAGVRGTDFYLSFEPNTRVTEQATISGKVQVEQVGTDQMVVVSSGRQVAVIEQTPEKEEKIEVKPLMVKPIAPALITEIKQTSLLVKNDKEFSSEEAIKILGSPEEWQAPEEEMPFDLKGLKEEF
ncbi:MAG: FecR domain-containing protein, partial [Bdellovibrionales bacterium]|nr:FecR domain-containing protein [Bdellovibrionales bacterium]